MLVLGPVVDEQEGPGRGKALDEAVEQGLRLGIDPVQVLEDHEHRLPLALPEQEVLDRVERALPALGRIERLPAGVIPGTSRRARKAGRIGSRVRSSVRSLPVTFSRISRWVSRSCTLK